ncbi:MAG: hypothetical protein KBF82_08735 [Chitinophagaceae bacterium]|nr:hypothetical protein [Chitinophagaceae bacterium]MBP9103933.1 hypothetical protein [Chitinophagaceae bacterium]
MKKIITLPFLLIAVLVVSCKDEDKKNPTTAESSIDAARNFIRAALDGKFKEARVFMLTDSINTNYMDVAERSFERVDQPTKDGYRASSINIHEKKVINDSTAILIYSNSFKNDHDTLKILRINNQWLVDFKYLYEHDRDTLMNKPITKDSLR